MKFSQVFLVSISILLVNSCFSSSASDDQVKPTSIVDNDANYSKTGRPSLSEWTQMDLPVKNAATLFSDEERIFVVGTDGIVEIGMVDNLRKIDLPVKVSEYFSKDGGLGLLRLDDEDGENSVSGTSDLCRPESAAIIKYRLFSIGPCEHTSQLWSFNLDRKSDDSSFTMGFTYSTYPDSDTNDPVYGPDQVIEVIDKVIFSAQLKSGPAILETTGNRPVFKVKWQGNKSDGSILSIDFLSNEGVMLTSKGRLMRSVDSGKTWKHFSDIPQKFVGNVWHTKFRNTSEGYIIGSSGIILHTTDAGKTWQEQESTAKGSLYKVVVNENHAVVLEDFKTLLSNNGEKWKKLEFEGNDQIDDILLYNKKLFVLAGSKLYVRELVFPNGK